ncbi:MAG: biotin transporter BioY [Deltaproteobacteria bacterium]|nr:biotin transporter BioY [Deltaproteobacteria bacterium]
MAPSTDDFSDWFSSNGPLDGDVIVVLSSPLHPQGTRSLQLIRARDWAQIFLGAAAIAGAARLALPFPGSPVPISAQTLAVLLVGWILGSRHGLSAVLLYLAAGAAGLPIFADGAFGIYHLRGPTGGYLAAFAAAAWLIGRLREQDWPKGFLGVTSAMLLGHTLILAIGALWLSSFVGWERAITGGVAPFLVGAAVKSALAAGIVVLWHRRGRASRASDALG